MYLLVLLMCATAPASPAVIGLDSLTQTTIKAGLDAQAVRPEELGYFKQWAVDSFFRLKIVDRLMDHPLDVAAYTESAAVRVTGLESLPVGLLMYEWSRTDVGWGAADSARLWREVEAAKTPLAGTEALAKPVAEAVNTVLAGYVVGKRYLDRAIAKLAPNELDRLLGLAPDFWRDSDDTTSKSLSGILHTEFGKTYDTSQQVKSETLLWYARKVDRKALAQSGLAVAMAAAEARRLLQAQPLGLPHEGMGLAAANVDGGVYFHAETPWGPVVVGGSGDNVYRKDCALIIDVGGSDRYLGRVAGGVGILGPPFGVVIDLAGNDRYESDRLFSQGAALFGAGVLIDCAGDDVYRSLHYTQGGAIYGTALLWDRSGDDFYDAGFYAHGAGQYGVGALVDGRGNDTYRSWSYCQGFAGTWGYGLLAELGGNDLYYAGGKVLHEPLLPHEYRSFSQGFAIGQRPDAAGGIGFLCDRSGNDFYNSEVFAQGTSYWYSLGMLWDGDGFDKYVAAQYTQGAGIHLSIGALVDEAGNDAYYSRLGPSQGEGHDLAVGVLVDRKGDDMYYCSGGQGVGLTNSVGLFVDEDGNDAYTCPETSISHGGGNPARGFGGMGLFMDLAGKDRYTQGDMASDQHEWTKGTYGAGQDLPRPATVVDEEPDVDTSDAGLDSIALPVDSVFKIASTWAVGNAQKRVKRARKQLNRMGRVALDYVFDKKVDSKDGLESEAIEALVKTWPDTAKPYMFKALRDPRFLARQNAAYWLGKLGRDAFDGVDSIYLALKAGKISPRRAAQVFGDIGDSTVVPKFLYLLHDKYEPSRIVTAEACGKLRNPVAIPDLITNLDDPLFTVRAAAEMALVAMGTVSLEPMLAAQPKMSPRALGASLRACASLVAKLDSADTVMPARLRQTFSLNLASKSEFVRLRAVAGLGLLMDEPTRAALIAARAGEKSEFVLNEYRLALGTH